MWLEVTNDWLVPFSKPLKMYVNFPIPGGVENLRLRTKYVSPSPYIGFSLEPGEKLFGHEYNSEKTHIKLWLDI